MKLGAAQSQQFLEIGNMQYGQGAVEKGQSGSENPHNPVEFVSQAAVRRLSNGSNFTPHRSPEFPGQPGSEEEFPRWRRPQKPALHQSVEQGAEANFFDRINPQKLTPDRPVSGRQKGKTVNSGRHNLEAMPSRDRSKVIHVESLIPSNRVVDIPVRKVVHVVNLNVAHEKTGSIFEELLPQPFSHRQQQHEEE